MSVAKILLILMQVTINSAAQVALKKGVATVNFGQPLWPLALSLLTNPYIFGGAFIFVVAFLLWLYLLSLFDLSFLYPASSLGFVITSVAGWLFFAEAITWSRGVGIVLILLGVMCIAKS
ncbi:MAG: EamA family transporter [Holosporaceae bacterium]|jgi:drug/metabolite transporter (DMT)-like permease|nr:EamA family transporter [Holosporaceae bacterium]